MDDIQKQLEKVKDAMEKAYKHTQVEFSKIRAGKAMPSILDSVKVTYYGNPTPIHQIASVNTPDARTIVIKPWEKSFISEIEKAIRECDIGLTPQNDGELIRINIPPLTEERRGLLVKQVKNETEKGKVGMRNARKEVKETLKRLQKEGIAEDEIKRAEEKVQELTDAYVGKIDKLMTHKETEIMEV
ncbi:MAG: ribosome recycling factor [Cytophagales bacterium]|nr:ribosome recycling factor [Cytophagales bacterium]